MNTFFYPLQKLNGFERAKECLDTGKTCQVTGCADSQLAHFITGLSDGYKNKVIVTFSGTKAKELYEALKAFCIVSCEGFHILFSRRTWKRNPAAKTGMHKETCRR